jgi:hypothetical protein
MTEKAMRCVRALRICHSNEDCRDCEFVESDRYEKSCVNVLFEDSADIIQSLSKQLESAQPKWISVEERLPEPFVSVIVHMPQERPCPTVHEGYRTKDGNWYSAHFVREFNEVTHWMPLPEPPKEVE